MLGISIPCTDDVVSRSVGAVAVYVCMYGMVYFVSILY